MRIFLFDSWLVPAFVARRGIACEEPHLELSNNEVWVRFLAYIYLADSVNNTFNLARNRFVFYCVSSQEKTDSIPVQGESANGLSNCEVYFLI